MIKGIDVSEHQRDIDWEKVKADGIDFTILRSSIGDDVDKEFKFNADVAHKAGVAIYGIYHFSFAANTKQAEEEAEFAAKLANDNGLNGCYIFFDFEYEGEDYLKKKGIAVTPSFVKDITNAFCNKVKSLGFKPGVYCNCDYYTRLYNCYIPEGVAFWVADWRKNPDKSIVNKADFHQFTSSGKVKGIRGQVDVNYDLRTSTSTNDIPAEPKKEEKPKLTEKDINRIANDVIAGKYGNGEDRKKKLTEAGYDYNVIQKKVNDILASKPAPAKKSLDEIVAAVIAGDFGNGEERKKKLTEAGYDYRTVQDAVNKALTPSHVSVSPAKGFDKSLSAEYTVTAEALNLRYIPGLLTSNNIMKLIYKGEKVRCWGYYTDVNGVRWLYVQKGNYTGYVDSRYVKK